MMVVQLPRWRFTIADYHRMAEAGILGEDDRVELIEGEVVEMTPIGRRHAACVKRLTKLFVRLFSDDAVIGVQDPVVLNDYSEPQPDLSLLRSQTDFYESDLPTSKDILLLVEVAFSSTDPDRRLKVPLYGRNRVPEVWLVDLEQETITVYTDPSPDGYRTACIARRDEQLAPSAFASRPLAVNDILG